MDAPIGYWGAPYTSHRSQDDTEVISKEMAALGVNMKLDQFPAEILALIASHLSQFEKLSLMGVNRHLNNVFTHTLYHSITIDHAFSQFNTREIAVTDTTFIKNSYSLKLFLKRLYQNADRLCPLVHSLSCIRLPGEIITIQLYESLRAIIPNMVNLKEISWYNSNDLDLNLLSKLPSELTKLHINTKSPHHLRLPESATCSLSISTGSLQSFAFTPFQNSENLYRIGSVFEFRNLKELRLARLYNKESLLVPPPNSLVTVENIVDFDLNSLPAFFKAIDSKLALHKLSIDGILIQPGDFEVLESSVDLSALKFLELVNSSEIVKVNSQNLSMLENLRNDELTHDMRHSLRSLIEPNFMMKLSSSHALANLRYIKLDVRQGLVDTLPHLLNSLQHLENIDVVSRWNTTKVFEHETFDELINKLVEAVLKHSQTLKSLSIELRRENPLINNESLYTMPNQSLERLLAEYFPQLCGLRLNLHANHLISNNKLLSRERFPELKFLNLFGNDIYNKHMGLEVVNPGILDDFFKIQHVVKNLLNELDTSLEYVMIDHDKVFEIFYNENGQMIGMEPRDGLDGWLIRNVRVDFFN